MTPREAAAIAGKDRLTILKWIRSGRLVAEAVETSHGKGYDITAEDLRQAMQAQRKKAETSLPAVAGSVVSELQALRQELAEARKAMQNQADELHDLRGQLAQTEDRLRAEIQKALPEPRRPRLWPFSKHT